MRKHSVRKWIHAVCDLLPLLVIPIFALAVRSDNNYQPIEVNYGGGYDVTPIYQTNEVNDLDDLVLGHLYYSPLLSLGDDTLHEFKIRVVAFSSAENITFDFLDEVISDEYNANTANTIEFWYVDYNYVISFTNRNSYVSFVPEEPYIDLYDCYFYVFDGLQGFKQICEVYDNTVTSSGDFNVYEVIYHDGQVYSDTDVGSQMMYTLYQTTDKYFNFNNVGVFQDLYDWFETNMFHGTAPMSFYIVWNVILFEFIMDLIFLTYMVFMFIIDFTECMIDRFFEKSYRGGR